MKQSRISNSLTKRNLSAPRQRLLEVMQEINFGKLEKLQVRGGEPVFNPSPRIVKEIKFGGENCPRRELGSDDFVLKAQVMELFSCLTNLGNGVVESLDVKYGLPFKMNLEGAIQP